MQQSGPVQTTKEEREAIKDQFLTVANGLFDQYSVHDHHPIAWSPKSYIHHAPRHLTADDVKMTQVWSDDKAAHLSVKRDGHWTLGIKYTTWRALAPLRRFAIVVHEAAHLPMNYFRFPAYEANRESFDITTNDSVESTGSMHHPFPYWVVFATLADRIDDRAAMFDAPVTGGPVVCKAISQSRRYAQGVTAASEWTEALLSVIDYDAELYNVFGRNGVGKQYELDYETTDDHTEIDAGNIWLDFPSDRELYEAVEDDITEYEHRGPRIELDEPPRVTNTTYSDPDDYEYKAVNPTAVALRLRQLRPTVDVVVE